MKYWKKWSARTGRPTAGRSPQSRSADGEYQIQFPIGKPLYASSGKLGWLAFSPRGDRLAFVEYPLLSDEAGSLKVVDLEGRVTTLSSGWKTIRGLDWSPAGDEVWVSGQRSRAGGAVSTRSRSRERGN